MGIRLKIFSGFLILSLMLAVAGTWSIRELNNIGMSVQRFLDENYRSIDAAKVMLESLEREDSGLLLLLLGQRKEGMDIIEEADKVFTKAFEIARSNITIPGEEAYVKTVEETYQGYKELWTMAMSGDKGSGDLS